MRVDIRINLAGIYVFSVLCLLYPLLKFMFSFFLLLFCSGVLFSIVFFLIGITAINIQPWQRKHVTRAEKRELLFGT